MIPEEFKQRIAAQKYIDADSLLKALEEPSPVSIRINRSKWNQIPADSQPVPWCLNGFYLGNRPSFTLDPLFHSGCYYPQEASGMFLEYAVRSSPVSLENIRVLDLCGAPGGKSTHLSDILGTGSLLIANDVIRSRAAILAETMTKWGASNTIVTQSDSSVFGRMHGYFDLILADAPCSGEGMFRTDIAVTEWSVNNTAHCAGRQKRILMNIWPSLKEGGILIYSTCTFNPAENEENIKWLIDKNEAEIVRLDVSPIPGITEIDFEGIFGYGFYPGRINGEGFFISVIRKTGRQDRISIKNQRKSELNPGKKDFNIAEKWTGFSNGNLLRWGDELFSVPCMIDEYMYLFQNLNITKAGTKIFKQKNDDFLPSPEFALSVKLKKDAFPSVEVSLSDALSYLKRDNLFLADAPKGWNTLKYNGVVLGFVNNLGPRVNNYFPVEWRIRMNLPEKGEENIINWVS